MGKLKERLLDYTIGTKVEVFTYRRCDNCCSWFKFRYDLANEELRAYGDYKVMCPSCNRMYCYNDVRHLPTDNLKFKEVD